MKNIKIIRTIDDLGRVVIPIDIRKNFDLEANDKVEIKSTKKGIYLKKHKLCVNYEKCL